MKNQVTILGISITNEVKEKVLEYLLNRLKSPHDKTFIITPNPEMLVYASKHLDYRNKLNSADIALPDGVGISLASHFVGKPLQGRITGVDFIEELCKISREKTLSMGFLGGRDGVAELAVNRLKHKYPWIEVVFVGEEWPDNKKNNELRIKNKEKGTINHYSSFINPPQIDILFVAFGVPNQEEWITEHLYKLPIKAAMGVGGSFDFLSGKVWRAPKFIRVIGLEWLFRLIVQPWRWKRQLALLEFLVLIWKQKFVKQKM
ncbi:MAG: WecB/TagA/CpsF family glycosyltransferase [Candidatus Levyibacteriota bacterium]